MKNIILKITGVMLALAFATASITANAETNNETVSEAQSLADGIIDFKLSQTGSDSVQDWIDGSLTENAGKASEWYIFSLSRYGNYDFSSYQKALSDYISSDSRITASTALKYALVLASTGSTDEFINEHTDDATGKQGVMSWIYGLHLLNNGYGSTATTDETIDALLGLQKDDGGWAVMGDVGETDATAMAVQALAPHYNENESVKNAVDKALLLLSERQLEGGDFASYGVPNPESTGQVLTALTSLGIDPISDERFIKNGNDLIDGLKIYRNDDGSFSHEKGKDYNENATVQTLYSLISYIRFSENKTPLYILEKEEETSESTPPVTSAEEMIVPDSNENVTENITDNSAENADYRLPVCLGIAGAAVVAVVVLVLLKKGKKQNIIAVAVIAAAGIIFVLATDFRSTDEYYGSVSEKKNPVGTVTISIRCDTIVGKSDAEYIPDDGIILNDSFLIEENETAFDILVEAAKKHSIQLDYSGTTGTIYISGINYIYEFDFGDLSGWMYLVNSEKPSVGCDGYVLSDGDNIEFLYSCEMGNDLN